MHAPAQHIHAGDALVVPGAQRQLAHHRLFIRVTVNGAVRPRRLHLDVQHRTVFVHHIHIKADTFAVNSYAEVLIRFEINYVLDLYVQNMFNKMLAEFLVLHHLQEHKVVGKCHGIPVYFNKFFQCFTFLSDRAVPSAKSLYHISPVNSMKFC